MEKQTNTKQIFLDYIKKTKAKDTFISYRVGLERFEKWYTKDCDTILEERRTDLASNEPMRIRRFNDILEQFHKDMIEKEGLGINTTRTLTLGITQFFSYWCLPIKVSFKTVVTKKSYIPSIEEFRTMYNIADLKGKVVISLGLDLAWRVGDFCTIKKQDIPDLTLECPIQIEKITDKEKELSSTFISCETVELLKVYMPNLPESNEYLFPNRNSGHLDAQNINDIIQTLGKKVQLKIPKGKHFTWHSIRKRFLSTATNLGIDTEVKDLLVGKAIDQSHMTYYGDLKLRNAFTEIRVKALALTTAPQNNQNHTRIEELTRELEMYKKIIIDLVKEKAGTSTIEPSSVTLSDDRENKWLRYLKELEAKRGTVET